MKVHEPYTTIRITRADRARMDLIKQPKETYAETVRQLLDQHNALKNTDTYK